MKEREREGIKERERTGAKGEGSKSNERLMDFVRYKLTYLSPTLSLSLLSLSLYFICFLFLLERSFVPLFLSCKLVTDSWGRKGRKSTVNNDTGFTICVLLTTIFFIVFSSFVFSSFVSSSFVSSWLHEHLTKEEPAGDDMFLSPVILMDFFHSCFMSENWFTFRTCKEWCSSFLFLREREREEEEERKKKVRVRERKKKS